MTRNVRENNIPSLHEVYQENFKIGAAVNPKTLQMQRDLLKKHFNSITAENEMKFEELQPLEGKFKFDVADQMVDFAQANGMQVRGHALVWHNQTPEWMFLNDDGTTVDRELLLERMKSHITTVMQRYKGKIFCWDVVNEAVSDDGEEILRKSRWTEIIGEDFIEYAFRFAHEADPEALLFYNDYNESDPIKRDKIYKLVTALLEKDVPIHGIGLQAHWNIKQPSYENVKEALEKYASLGLRIHLTELDMSVFEFSDRRTDLTEPTEEMLSLQAKRYDKFFDILREYSNVIDSVTFWGAADDYTWLSGFPVRGRKNWPFVFDETHLPKESFWKIIDF